MSSDTQRSGPTVHPEDVQLAILLRRLQWTCDDLAHSVPGRRADLDEVAFLMDAMPVLEVALERYVQRQRTPVIDGEP